MMHINDDCTGCMMCEGECPFDAIDPSANYKFQINPDKCKECNPCFIVKSEMCDYNAIQIVGE